MTWLTKVSASGKMAGAVLSLSLLRCSPSPSPQPPGKPIGAHKDTLISCTTSSECRLNAPSCVVDAPSCMDGHCVFTVQTNSTCLPPDINFCDYTNGGHPECNVTNLTYPDASVCGIRECTNASTCTWGSCMALAH
jgi:hypothetical protein